MNESKSVEGGRREFYVANIRHTTTKSNIYTGQGKTFDGELWKSHQFTIHPMENICAIRKFPISYLFERFLFADSWNILGSDGIFSSPHEDSKQKEKLLKYSKTFSFSSTKVSPCLRSFWNPIWKLIDKRTKWVDSLIFHLKLLTFVRGRVGRVWPDPAEIIDRKVLLAFPTHLRVCVWVDKLAVNAKQNDWYQARYHSE